MSSGVRIPDILHLPTPLAYDTFGRADGALGSSEAVGPDGQQTPQLAWSGATWAIVSGVAVNTPTAGSELVTNGDMETGDPPTGWNATQSNIAQVLDERTGGGGTHAIQVTATSANGRAYNTIATTAGKWYLLSIWAKGTGTQQPRVIVYSSPGNIQDFAGLTFPGNATWTLGIGTFRASENSETLRCYAWANGDVTYFDDASVKALSLPTLFSTHAYLTTNVMADATLAAYTTGTQAGMVLRLDSAASPANFIIAYQDSGNVKIDECVAGVYTNLGTYASAYAASNALRVSLDGNAWRLYKITSAGAATLLGSGTTNVTTGTRHGLFSTDSGNSLDGWQCWARGNEGQYEGLSAL